MAKVGSKPITKAELKSVMATAVTPGTASPARGSAEYRLIQEQAIDFLVQKSLAHQADAELGIRPEDRVVTHASWLKVVGGVHVSDAEVRAVFAKDPKRYKLPGPNRTLDRGAAHEIRVELLAKKRAAAMHRFVADAERRWPVTYAPGYRPVSEMALARTIWTVPAHERCDLPEGMYPYGEARAHGCLTHTPIPGMGSPACSLLDLPSGPDGFTGAEMDDGYGGYVMDNAGTCVPDPRLQGVQVEPERSNAPPPPVKVSYLHATGTATYKGPLLAGLTLSYPRRLHIQQFEYGSFANTEAVEIANFALDSSGPTSRPLSARAVEFLLTDRCEGWNGPGSQVVKLPIKRLPLASGAYSACFSANGGLYGLGIRTGSSPSHQDLEALRAIAASIHFPPPRVGQVTPNGPYVLGRASAYPPGSVTEIPAIQTLKSGRFYLEHAADGFWAISWPDNLLHGYKACGPRWDAAHRRFTCPSGAVWDFKGRVVKNPDPARDQDDPLERAPVSVADGDVVLPLPPRLY